MSIYTKHADAATTDIERMNKAWCDALLANRRKVPHVSARAAAIRDDAIRNHLFYRGYIAYQQGNFGVARLRFADALKQGGFSLRAAAMWAMCRLPAPLTRFARRAKRLATVTPPLS
jgi:hypothetical protein